MKPREFDGLVKRKFEEGAFEYKAQNWDRLAEELDGREKKRGLLVWWMPLIGVAASVALAMGVPVMLREGGSVNTKPGNAKYAQAAAPVAAPGTTEVAVAIPAVAQPVAVPEAEKHAAHHAIATPHAEGLIADNNITTDNNIHTGEEEAQKPLVFNSALPHKNKVPGFDAVIETFITPKDPLKKVKKVLPAVGFYTFKEPAARKDEPKLAISVSGGISHGLQANGYTVGATARRMINDKVYVEGDIAFIGNSNSNTYSETVYSEVSSTDVTTMANTKSTPSGNSTIVAGGGAPASMHSANLAARGAIPEKNTSEVVAVAEPVVQSRTRTVEKTYNAYYAQVTPTIGYKVTKRLSVGGGPDFQQMLVDNRPATSPTQTGNIQEAPLFDVGFMGKTEYAVSRNIKAAVYYREGINNVITPMNKFIDRNYVQFQIKCAILNR